MAHYIDWPGRSGRIYRYYFANLSLPFVAVPLNYAFVKRLANGNFLPIYFGETSNGHDRLTPSHEHWATAFRMGATDVMAHTTQGGELVRCAEEQDLIEQWDPPLNTQHRRKA